MKKVIAFGTLIALSLAIASPAQAWYRGWGYGGGWGPGWGYGGYGYGMGYGGWGYGGYGAAMGVGMGAALLGGVIGGAIASQQYAPAPVYVYPDQPRRVRQQVIIKNSPGAQVYEENDFGW